MISKFQQIPAVRILGALLLMIGLSFAGPAVAGAAPSALPKCATSTYSSNMVLKANPTTVNPGGTIIISGEGYPPSCNLEIFVDGNSVGFVDTTPAGTFDGFQYKVPADRKPGEIVITTVVGGATATAMVKVVTPGTTPAPVATTPGTATAPPTGSAAPLPATGSNVLPLVAGGVALLVIGSLVVLSSRKRSTQSV